MFSRHKDCLALIGKNTTLPAMAHHSSNRKRRSESGSPTSAAKRNKDAVDSPVDDKGNESALNPLGRMSPVLPSSTAAMRGTKRSRPWLPRPCRTQWDAVAEDASEDAVVIATNASLKQKVDYYHFDWQDHNRKGPPSNTVSCAEMRSEVEGHHSWAH